MKAYLFFYVSLNDIPPKIISNLEDDSVVILTEQGLYTEFTNKFSNLKSIFINIFDDEYSIKATATAEKIMKEIHEKTSRQTIRGYNFSELLINELFSSIELVFNLIEKLEEVKEKHHITELCLYEGNPKVQFAPMALSEGERAFRFMYKRAWFLNYFVYKAFSEDIRIEWNYITPRIYLMFIRNIRSIIILIGKLFKIIMKIYLSRKNTVDKKYENTQNPIILLVVRNPIQVEPLLPIYNEIDKNKDFTPLFIAIENYSNNNLIDTLERQKVSFIDSFQSLTFVSIAKCIYEIKKINTLSAMHKISKVSFATKCVDIDLNDIIVNLRPFIFDILLFDNIFNRFVSKGNDVQCLINNETHSYHPAIQTEWIRKRKGFSFGIQHVTIAYRFKPRISRVDTMFMMSKEIMCKLSEIKPDEKFVFLGPVSYDNFFNTTSHLNQFNTISIFTQPDDYKREYLQIIEDIIEIVNLNALDFSINIKLHPRERDYDSFNSIIKKYANIKIINYELSSNELIKMSDLVLSIHSGILMQSIIIGTPGISINYSNKHNINVDFINHNVTKKVFSKRELESCLLNLDLIDNEYKMNRENFINNILSNYDGKAAEKVFAFIKKKLEA